MMPLPADADAIRHTLAYCLCRHAAADTLPYAMHDAATLFRCRHITPLRRFAAPPLRCQSAAAPLRCLIDAAADFHDIDSHAVCHTLIRHAADATPLTLR